MPRILPTTYHQLRSPLAKLLLPTCRTTSQALQELHWIKEELPQHQWHTACLERNRKVPLQYILGTQPFGSVDVKCEKGVLIPRWETEEYTVKIINKLRQIESVRKVVDVCSGTGCIPLLIGKELRDLEAKGYDVSTKAIDLASRNAVENKVNNVTFQLGDVFNSNLLEGEKFEFVTANPPYISIKDYQCNDVEPSVRKYEPKLALVGGTEFYKALIENVVIPSGAKGFLFELGYEEQYQFTKSLLDENEWGTKMYWDSADKHRCVIGWKIGSQFDIFESF